jgi:hypothetical protein
VAVEFPFWILLLANDKKVMTVNILLRIAIFIVFIIPCELLHAKQLSFSKIEKEKSYIFNYSWQDQNTTEQSLSFSLTKESLFDRFRNFRIYKAELAQQYVRTALQRHLRKNPIRNVIVDFETSTADGRLKIRGQDQQAINQAYSKIAALEFELAQQFLKDNYYHQFTTHNQINAVKPDHARFAKMASSDFKTIKPLILEKFSIKNIRQVTNFVLGFIQSIPYSTLESRVTASGAGFNPPSKLLWENQGDCDSKVTLAAALLRSLMPRVKMVLVFIDNHALIGIKVPALAGDLTIQVNSVTYVLGEPTGPASLKLGKVAQESELSILSGQFSAEEFHAKAK